jgi:hypothetical protein
MEKVSGLDQIEKKAYWSYHRDGLIDLCLGFVFLLFGIQVFTGNPVIAGLCWMPGLLIAPLKRLLTAPRIGTVRFRMSWKVRAVKIGLLTFTAAFVLFIVAAELSKSTAMHEWTRRYFAIAFGFSLALFPLAGAIALGIKRYYAHAALLAAGFSFVQYRNENLAGVFVGIGSVLIVTGGTVLIRFLNGNPIDGNPIGGKEEIS